MKAPGHSRSVINPNGLLLPVMQKSTMRPPTPGVTERTISVKVENRRIKSIAGDPPPKSSMNHVCLGATIGLTVYRKGMMTTLKVPKTRLVGVTSTQLETSMCRAVITLLPCQDPGLRQLWRNLSFILSCSDETARTQAHTIV